MTAAIDTSGVLWTWGSNQYGLLGTGTEASSSATPVRVMDNVVSVVCGSEHIAALRGDGSLWLWGSNQRGQLGTGGTGNAGTYPSDYQTVPVKITDDVKLMRCGPDHMAAIKTDGSLWMWGDNDTGALGNGGKYNLTVPQLHPLPDAKVQTVPVKVMDGVEDV